MLRSSGSIATEVLCELALRFSPGRGRPSAITPCSAKGSFVGDDQSGATAGKHAETRVRLRDAASGARSSCGDRCAPRGELERWKAGRLERAWAWEGVLGANRGVGRVGDSAFLSRPSLETLSESLSLSPRTRAERAAEPP